MPLLLNQSFANIEGAIGAVGEENGLLPLPVKNPRGESLNDISQIAGLQAALLHKHFEFHNEPRLRQRDGPDLEAIWAGLFWKILPGLASSQEWNLRLIQSEVFLVLIWNIVAERLKAVLLNLLDVPLCSADSTFYVVSIFTIVLLLISIYLLLLAIL